MTHRALYGYAKEALAAGGIDSPAEDALLLLEAFFGLDRAGLALHGEETPPAEREAAFRRGVEERKDRRPLQYILGSWEFMGLPLLVGEGVLIPREDTAVLVEALARRLRAAGITAPTGVDLCAGSGAVALGLCSLLPDASVDCLELSDPAFSYLEKNLAAHPEFRVRSKKGDALLRETAERFPPAGLDFIVSNPPYIRTGELASLQAEVQREPSLALDGGGDGLIFYRAIADLWLSRLKPGGVLAVEIGEDQGDDVSALFAARDLRDIEIRKDLSGLDRVVIGRQPSDTGYSND